MLELASIVTDSIVDGPGIRTTIFAQGCPHRCPGCHNPESWEFGKGVMMSEEEVFSIIRSNPLSKGVTFSGGEPFAQAAGFAKLSQMLKRAGYEVAAYSGYTFEEIMKSEEMKVLLSSIDVLIDGPFILAERSLELNFRGSRNQRVLNVPESLASGVAILERSLRWLGEY